MNKYKELAEEFLEDNNNSQKSGLAYLDSISSANDAGFIQGVKFFAKFLDERITKEECEHDLDTLANCTKCKKDCSAKLHYVNNPKKIEKITLDYDETPRSDYQMFKRKINELIDRENENT